MTLMRPRGRTIPGQAVLQDVRFALRLFLRQPGFTALALLTLTLGVGATTAVFTVAYSLLRPLPYPDSERLVRLAGSTRTGAPTALSPLDFMDYQQGIPSLEAAAAWQRVRRNLTGGSEPDRLMGAAVTEDFFRVARTWPAIGRAFTGDEFVPGGDHAVILSYGLWQSRFGGDPAVIGRAVQLNASPSTVVGIMPSGFDLPADSQFWIPRVFDDGDRRPGQRGARNLSAIARLKAGASLAAARTEAAMLADRLAAEYPGTNADLGARVDPLLDVTVATARPALLTLVGAVALLLLVACVNTANLLLARAAGRRTELAIRGALGAGRSRLIRQLFVESALLAVVAGATGLLAAAWGIRLLSVLQPDTLPRADEIVVAWPTALIALAVAGVTTILFGTLPAVQASRIDLVTALKEGARTAAASHGRTRRFLVIGQLALAVVLLAGAGLLVRSFAQLQQVETGFDPAGVLTFTVSLSDATYPDSGRVIDFFERLEREISGIHGVDTAGFIFGLPLGGINGNSSFDIQGRPLDDEPIALIRVVGGRYFETLRLPLRRGRTFDDRDHARSAPVALVNEAAVRQYWGGESPVGQHLRVHASFVSDRRFGYREIVGIVGDVKHGGLAGETRPEVYIPFEQQAIGLATVALRVQDDGDPLALLPPVRERMRAIDPAVPMSEVARMDDLVGRSVATRRFTMLVLGTFALSAVLLALVGIYGVVSYLVTQRRREIGIRLALGAPRSGVVWLIVRQSLATAAIGIVVGVAASLPLTELIRHMLFGIGPRDPLTFAAVPVVLAIGAALASYLPARRAARVDPAEALQSE